MKIKLIVLSMAMIMSITAANASDLGSFEEPVFGSDGLVTISCNIGKANTEISLRVYKKGDNPKKDDFVAILQKTSGSSGDADFIFKIPRRKDGVSTNGTYVVEYSVFGGKKQQVTEFDYLNFEYLIEELRKAKIAYEVKALFSADSEENRAALQMMKFDMTGYDILSDEEKTNAMTCFLKLADLENDDLDSLRSSYSRAVGISLIKTGEALKGLWYINPEFEGTLYSDAEDEFKSRICKAILCMAPLSEEEFDDAYEECCEVYKLVNSNSYETGECIKTKGTAFGLSKSAMWKEYSSMTAIQKGYVHDAMIKLFDNSVYSYSDALDIFEAAVSEVNELISHNTGGGSGKSSGGGGGGASAGSKAETVFHPQNTSRRYKDTVGYEWAEEAIDALSENNILSGYSDGTFLPQRSMTREEFVKVLVLAADFYNASCECSFEDVESDAWYYSYVASAVQSGLVNGISSESFGTGNTVTRQDASVMICRAAMKKGIVFSEAEKDADFTDEQMISDYAKESVKKLYNEGIISGIGDSSFAPTDSLTRAQAAKLIYECFFSTDTKEGNAN